MNFEKYNLFGVKYAAVDYDTLSDIILEKARERKSFGVSSIDLKKLLNKEPGVISEKINDIDLILPASKLINRALNSFYHLSLNEEITEEDMVNQIMATAHLNGLNVYLYGSTKHTLTRVCNYLNQHFPFVNVVGVYVEKYLDFDDEDETEDIERINHTAANIVLVGKETGNQDAWIADQLGKINSVMVSAGPAFNSFFENGNIVDTPLRVTFEFRLKQFLHKLSHFFRNFSHNFVTHLRFNLLFYKHKFFMRRPA